MDETRWLTAQCLGDLLLFAEGLIPARKTWLITHAFLESAWRVIPTHAHQRLVEIQQAVNMGPDVAGTDRWARRALWLFSQMTVYNSVRILVGRERIDEGWLISYVRDIVGNPFRPLSPRSFSPTVLGIAEGIYRGDRAAFPILADALEEDGASEAALHCREKVHCPGCDVVDWILQKN